ncbi:MAG: hypothetical protein DI537_19145 [Stutzerimonas stutzeri]|nr:MAG: hypothetical protein DI537_19145 [Stutzerimonas stutzeri]
MATYTPADYAKTAGIPSQSSDTIAVLLEGLITGSFPEVSTEDMTVAASQTIPAYTPVGLNGSGHIVPAVSGTTQAIGIVVHDVTTGASPITGFPVWRAGVFNPAMLAWPASYNTDELKLEAFRGAPSPTQIIMRPVKSGTVTLP